MIGAAFLQLFTSRCLFSLGGTDREAMGQSSGIPVPGDCFPVCVLDGSFLHADPFAPGTIGLSPGKTGGFTPARPLDMRAPREGAR
jgi:hypothetical protein